MHWYIGQLVLSSQEDNEMAAFLMGLTFLFSLVMFGVAVAIPHKRLLQRRLLLAAISLLIGSALLSAIFVFNN